MALREDQIEAAVRFLTNDKVAQSSHSEKESFLSQKGLTHAEIAEAMRRALSPGEAGGGRPAVSSTYGPPVVQGYPGVQGSYAVPGAMPPALPAPSPWPALPPFRLLQQRSGAPWWALLFSGLGLGTAVALLANLFVQWLRRKARPALSPVVHPPLVQTPHSGIAAGGSVDTSAVTPAAATGETASAAKLADLAARMKEHVEETRASTASIRRSLEEQQRLYQMAAADFQRKLEETTKKKAANTCLRVEIASESMQMLKSLVASTSSQNGANQVAASASSMGVANAESVKSWFAHVEESLQSLLRSAESQVDAKRSLQTVSMIIHNLVNSPAQEKFREVSATSNRFKETFGAEQDSGAAQLLKLAGFELKDAVFTFPAERSLDEARRVRDFLQDAIRDCSQRWQTAMGSTTNGCANADATAIGDTVSAPSEADALLPAQDPKLKSLEGSSGGGLNGHASSMPSAAAGGDGTGGQQETPPAAPWLSTMVQKQLSRVPAGASASSSAAPAPGQEAAGAAGG